MKLHGREMTQATTNKTWSEWLGIDAASRQEKREKKEAAGKAKHDAAVEDLRARLLNSEEGRLCAKQLASSECAAQRARARALLLMCAPPADVQGGAPAAAGR